MDLIKTTRQLKASKMRLRLLSLLSGLGLLLAGRLTAQTFTTLYALTNADGFPPVGGLVLSGNILYGTTSSIGGTNRAASSLLTPMARALQSCTVSLLTTERIRIRLGD
jgi:hypothetical protein